MTELAWCLAAVVLVLVLVRIAAAVRDSWDRERAFRELKRKGRP